MISALFLVAPLLLTLPPADQTELPVPDQIAYLDDGSRMTVPVTIGHTRGMPDAGPYRFIVDTGAERTVISRELAGSLGLAAGPSVHLTTMAGSSSVATVLIPAITVGSVDGAARLGGQRIEAPALVARYLGAAGLIGIDTLQGHALTIDFDRQAMTVAPATKRSRIEQFGPGDIVIRARTRLGQLVVTNASYRGRRIRVVVDTGSVVSMGNLALRQLVARSSAAMSQISLTSVTGGTLLADYAQVEEIRLGETGFTNMPMAFSDAAPFRRLGLLQQPAMLLGMDALRLFGRVRIDFANRELRLERPHPRPR